MAVKYGKFEMPDKIKVDESNKSTQFSKFIVEPFERGFGHTIGNALRRIMLTSLEAPAIMSIRMEGVPHEYAAIDGIIEDMTHIILNLKNSLLRYLPTDSERTSKEVKIISKTLDISQEDIEKGEGEYRVTLQDLMEGSPFEMVNPHLHIFTITKPLVKKIDIKVAIGRGYVPSERQTAERQFDEIILDSIFSPVRLVNYYVENTRVGQDTDFDRLILEIKTDGRVTPQEALTFAAQIGIEHFAVFDTLKTHSIIFEQEEVEANKDREELLKKLALKINEIELSVRSTNCLSSANIETIGELVVMPELEMLKFRNFGKKSLTEIKQKLEEMGLYLGMDLSKYGINKDNIKMVIQNYLDNKAGSEES